MLAFSELMAVLGLGMPSRLFLFVVGVAHDFCTAIAKPFNTSAASLSF